MSTQGEPIAVACHPASAMPSAAFAIRLSNTAGRCDMTRELSWNLLPPSPPLSPTFSASLPGWLSGRSRMVTRRRQLGCCVTFRQAGRVGWRA